MTTPATNIAVALNAAGLGFSFFAHPEMSPDDDGVVSGALAHRVGFVEMNPAQQDKVPIKGGGNNLPYAFIVTVRSVAQAFVQGETDAVAVYNFLDQTPFSPYFEIECAGSFPEWAGPSKDRQHRFLIFGTAWEREV